MPTPLTMQTKSGSRFAFLAVTIVGFGVAIYGYNFGLLHMYQEPEERIIPKPTIRRLIDVRSVTEQNINKGDDMMMKREQKRRRHILEEACQKLNLSRSLPDLSARYTGHIIVDDEYKILFNFIPKVSCTTWKNLFNKLFYTHRHKLRRGYLSAYTEEEKQYRLDNYRKAVFVREPITRLLSAYLSFTNQKRLQRLWEQMYGRSIVKRYRKDYENYTPRKPCNATTPDPFLNITLAEFIQYITDIGDQIKLHAISDHWLPQNLVATPCAIQYDFIGHFENLSPEAPYMLKFLGVDHIVKYPLIHESAARNKLIDAYTNVPLDLISRLRKYYRADYALFGYSFADTWHTIVEENFYDDEDKIL